MAAFMNDFVGDGNGYVGNLDLQPEVAGTLSLTADWHDAEEAQWGVKVTPYYTDVEDYIDAVQWDSTSNAPRIIPVVDNFTVPKYFNQFLSIALRRLPESPCGTRNKTDSGQVPLSPPPRPRGSAPRPVHLWTRSADRRSRPRN